MMRFSLAIMLMVYSFLAFGQHAMFYMTFPENSYYVPKQESAKTIGDSGFFEEPTRGYLILENQDTIKNLSLQYDCFDEAILARDFVKSSMEKWKRLSIERVKYLNANGVILFNPELAGFKPLSDNETISGLVELNFFSDKAEFLMGRYYRGELQRADYNHTFDRGEKDNKVIINSKRYLFFKRKYFELPISRTKCRKVIFEQLGVSIEKSLDTKDDNALITFLNQNIKN